ncbi:MAG: hypothetical protein ACPG5B_04495 [Chitinophagales bacterium]
MSKKTNNINLEQDIVRKKQKLNTELLKMYAQNLLPENLSWEVENSLLDDEEAMAWVDEFSEEKEIDPLENMNQLFEQKMLAKQNFSQHIVADEASIDNLLQSFLDSEVCEAIEEYELAMATTFRAATVFEMLTPKDGSFLKNVIEFLWKGKEELELIIENNDYEPLFEGNIKNGFNLQLLEKEFVNGLYYYKLIANGELLKIGKFYIFR